MTHPPSTPSSSPLFVRRGPLLIALVLFVTGFGIGSTYFRTVLSAGQPWFFQSDFGPAVMAACGRPFLAPDDAQIPRLAEFLRTNVDHFSCGDLPEPAPLRGDVGAQPWLTWSHLMRLAAIVWRWSGISWAGLAPIAGLFLGSTAALSFVLLRLIVSTPLAVAGTAAMLTSPLMITHVPHFRDFSKVPFMLAIAWVFAMLIATPLRPGRLLALAATYAVVLGVSLGFRSDPLVTVPVFLSLVAMAQLEAGGWRWKALAIALSALLALVSATPILRAFSQGGGSYLSHAALLGLMSPVDAELGIAPDHPYEVGYGVTDSYGAVVASAFATRRTGAPQPISYRSAAYDAASREYLQNVVVTLPADMVARAYAATLRVARLPSFSPTNLGPPPFVRSPTALGFFAVRSAIARALNVVWLPALVVALLLVAARDVRLAATLTALCAYSSAYSAIQFNQRHIIHLELIGVAALLFIVHTTITRQWRGSIRAALLFAAIAAALAALPLAIARQYQQRTLTGLFNAYIAAPLAPLSMNTADRENGRTEVVRQDSDAAQWIHANPDAVLTEYVVAEVGSCDVPSVSMTLLYDGTPERSSFARDYEIRTAPPGHVTRVMIATFAYRYSGGAIWYHWRGFELPTNHLRCLVRVAKMQSPDRFPVLLNATLPPGWEDHPLYARIATW